MTSPVVPAPTLSFRMRLTVRWTAVFSCVLAAASVWIYLGIRAVSYADLDRQLRTLAGTEVASAMDGPIAPHVHELPVTALAGGVFTEKLVEVFDARGRRVVTSPGKAETLAFVDPALVTAALAGHAPVATTEAGGLPLRVVVLRTVHDGRAFAVAVGVVIADHIASLTRVRWLLALVWLVSTAATSAVGFALASTALGPVRAITERAVNIAATDVRARLPAPLVDDEIGAMTRALNSLIERLHAALEANRRFAADAAHELRSPVTAMAGEIDVALRRERSAGEYRETLALVRSRLSSLSSVIADLMLLVRAQETRHAIGRQELSLAALVSQAVSRLEAVARARDITVRVADMGGLTVYGEAGLLGRVLDNVLENALRYNRERGQVTVEATFSEPRAGEWSAGVITLLVTDTGPGIPADDVERVFDRFYRVDASRTRHTGGAGLGLAIAREVLAMFSATIRVASSSDRGTTIEIRLPGRDAKGAEPVAVSDGPAAVAGVG